MNFENKEVRIAERIERRLNAKDKKLNNMNEKIDPYFPKFVDFNGTILIRRDGDDGHIYDYYCYNGNWGVKAYLERNDFGEPYPMSRRDEHFKTNVRLRKATEEDWFNCVGEYRPKHIKLEGGYMTSDGVYLPDNKTIEWGLSLSKSSTDIPLGDWQTCTLSTLELKEEKTNNELMYLLIRC